MAARFPAIPVASFRCNFKWVDFRAAKTGMRGMRKDELATKLAQLIRQVYLFIPIVILESSPFSMGYSVYPRGYAGNHLCGRCQLAVAEQDGHSRQYSRRWSPGRAQSWRSDHRGLCLPPV